MVVRIRRSGRGASRLSVPPAQPERLALPDPGQDGNGDKRPIPLRRVRYQPPDSVAVERRKLAPHDLRPFAPLEPADRVRRDQPGTSGGAEHPAEDGEDAPDRPGGVRPWAEAGMMLVTGRLTLGLGPSGITSLDTNGSVEDVCAAPAAD